ncbi:uncharacterized protein LOC127264880 [Andrographis paniculata]|uniref:uncharacterized protein LOC127264880 n=1 Tax=Andrographis paniculata TaxID=175694 RepID=UPI0021E78CEB|nr:uncharacterized protein LOC127264880 [Andrographis paniculata]
MEGIEMAAPPQDQSSVDEFCSAVLSQFSNSKKENHLHICTAIGAMSQELKDQNLPITPIAYFGATCSSLDRLLSSVDPPCHLLDALIAILSLVIDRFSPAVLKTKYSYLSELLNRLLSLKTVGDNSVVHALKCASRLLIVRDKIGWEDVSQLHGVLISYVTDDRGKVRKQSHLCLREVLKYFQSVPMLVPLHSQASEVIVNVFERFLLLAGGSNASVSEGSKAAQEVLYILDALKICLPYMASTSSTKILKHYKSLLELKHPIVTKRITDGLNALCLHSAGDISAELLVDLLCSLGFSVSANPSSADSMTFTTRLLNIGMNLVYSRNRQICVVKLPVIFNALKEVLASEHEGAAVASMETFKSLINSCIDEILIKQGVDEIITNANAAIRKSGPTIIEKVCSTIESLLDYHYEAVWDMSFQIASTMFNKLGKSSFYLLKGTLKNLADLQKLPDEDFVFRKQLTQCVGAALSSMGPEAFLSLIPLNLEDEDLSESNLWLFPILKQYTVGAHLQFFSKSILPLVGKMKQKSAALEQEGKLQFARSIDGIVYSLWSLLPSFCNFPVDTSESFKYLERALCATLKEEPDVRGIICSSLQILIQQNKKIVEGKDNSTNSELQVAEERAIAHYTAQVAESNLSSLKSSARELFSALTGVYLDSSKDTAGILQSTIGDLASISDRQVVSWIFKRTMQKLLKVTQEAANSNDTKNSNMMQIDSSDDGSRSKGRARLFDLAVSFLPGLDSKEIDLLFIAIQPALKDADGLIQKRAYRVLSIIFQGSDDFISRRLGEMLNLMIEVLPSCHFSAKRHRLDCLYFLIIYVLKEGSEQRRQDITASFLTEIILALKEANKKTRNQASDILVQIGRICGDENGGKEKLHQFFNMVAGGLAGESPHMISAAMTGLARLAYEFSDLVSAAYNVLPSALLLLQRKNKEIIKANLGLLKVLVAKSPTDSLQTYLRSMVEGLLNWQDSTRNHFKAKVKLLLGMLVRKCGLDAVKEVMPEEHMKLLTNIRKLKERTERKQSAKSSEDRSIQSRATTSRMSRWNHTRIFSDFDDVETRNSDGEFADGKSISTRRSKFSSAMQSKASLLRSKRARKAAKSLQEDSFNQLDDEPLDLLDSQRTRSALRLSQPLKRKPDLEDELEIDSEGRLIIREDGKRKQKRDPSLETGEADDGRSEISGSSRKTKKRLKTTSEAGWAYTGKEYASKKARGDLKRKDKLEPYAYWPLDRKMMSRRPEQRAAARRGMASVVKLTKKLEGKSVSNALSMSKKRKKNGN